MQKKFGKSFSEYVRFEKVVLWVIAIVALGRLALSLGGADQVAKWLSITTVLILGTVYIAIRVHTSGFGDYKLRFTSQPGADHERVQITSFGSYKQLLPLVWIQTVLGESIVAASIVLAMVTGRDNIFSAPEFSGGTDGKNWGHVGAHLFIGFVLGPIVLWIIGSLILLVAKKVAPREMGGMAVPGA